MSFEPTEIFGDAILSPSAATSAEVALSCVRSILTPLTQPQLRDLRTNLTDLRQVLNSRDDTFSSKLSSNQSAVSLLRKQQQNIGATQNALKGVFSAVPTSEALGCPEYIQMLDNLSKNVLATLAEGNELQFRLEQLDVQASNLQKDRKSLLNQVQRVDRTILAISQLLGEA